jgi:hypothetical protein
MRFAPAPSGAVLEMLLANGEGDKPFGSARPIASEEASRGLLRRVQG